MSSGIVLKVSSKPRDCRPAPLTFCCSDFYFVGVVLITMVLFMVLAVFAVIFLPALLTFMAGRVRWVALTGRSFSLRFRGRL